MIGLETDKQGTPAAAPFSGETMRCVVCGGTLKAGAQRTDWRCLSIDGRRFYACRKEFPPDGSTAEAFKIAYQKVIAVALRAACVK